MNGSDIWKAFAMPIGLMVLFVVALFSVFGISKNLIKPPVIDIISGNEIVTDQSEVPITGVVHNTSKLLINGKEVHVGQDGGFSAVIPVVLGENKVEIAAGNTGAVKSSVKVTREAPQKAIAGANVQSNLSASGPVESIMGSFGLAAIIISLVIYGKSVRQNALQNA